MAVALSGRFTNGTRLRRELSEAGALFRTSTEAEVLTLLIARSRQSTLVNRVVDALWRVEGAYCAVVLTPKRLVAVRDAHGFRPLAMGRIGEGWALATEGAALLQAGGSSVREVGRGEMVIIDPRGCERVEPFPRRPRRVCAQEHVGLASSDAWVFGAEVYAHRRGLGQRLATEHPAPENAVVVALGHSAEVSAVAYAAAARCTYEAALRRVRGPSDGTSRWRVAAAAVEGRPVVMVASGVVTGAAVMGAARALRAAGASGVVLRVAAPAVRHACVYGVASPTTDELLAARADEPSSIAQAVGVDDAALLSLEGLRAVLGTRADGTPRHCLACWTGDHPVVPEEPDDQLPLF